MVYVSCDGDSCDVTISYINPLATTEMLTDRGDAVELRRSRCPQQHLNRVLGPVWPLHQSTTVISVTKGPLKLVPDGFIKVWTIHHVVLEKKIFLRRLGRHLPPFDGIDVISCAGKLSRRVVSDIALIIPLSHTLTLSPLLFSPLHGEVYQPFSSWPISPAPGSRVVRK